MKLIHLSDLHIGKRVNDFSMVEDQKYILTKILNIIDDESPDAILIAGDVYDKSIPSAEAMELLDSFINSLAQRKIETFIIAGNHDSAERMAFASKLIDKTGIHISPAYDGEVKPRVLEDEHGVVNIYMLPFIKPIHIKQAFGIEESMSYSNAVKIAIEKMNVDKSQRNVIISHQFVIGASTCDSEDISVGGTDGVSADAYDDFDYVALGHIHGPQSVTRPTIRYSGTPLKYSFSEAKHNKSVTVLEMGAKGDIAIREVSLKAKRDMVEIKGEYNTIMNKQFYSELNLDDYYRIILTDEDDVPDAISKLRNVYKNIMRLEYDNKRTKAIANLMGAKRVEDVAPIDLVSELYEKQNGAPMKDEQIDYIKTIIEKIVEG